MSGDAGERTLGVDWGGSAAAPGVVSRVQGVEVCGGVGHEDEVGGRRTRGPGTARGANRCRQRLHLVRLRLDWATGEAGVSLAQGKMQEGRRWGKGAEGEAENEICKKR